MFPDGVMVSVATPSTAKQVVTPLVVLALIWCVAGRPHDASAAWKRARPLMIVLDKYAVHKSHTVGTAQPALLAANVHLVYLPSYCPDLCAMEPVWNDVKQHHMPIRSVERVVERTRAVDAALAHKARQLRQAYAKTTNFAHVST
jgi:hypothetical protein